MPYSRRDFLKTTGTALAAAPWIRTTSIAPSDTLTIGLIGANGMGFFDLTNHLKQPGIVCGGLCDVDQHVLDSRAADVETSTGKRPPLFGDYRELLDEHDIDAVIIGTPDHWHCRIMADAVAAGKDVYVEKPMGNSIYELDAMVKACRDSGRIVQVGQQQRSGEHWQDVVAFVQSGKLGDIRMVKVWGFFDYGKGAPRVPDEPAPDYVDFDMWLGPAPKQPFNPSRFHGVWRFQWDFGGGLLTDWGVHLLDIVVWAMKIERPPKAVSASGGIYTYTDRALETPDTLSVLYDMGDYTISWEHAGGIEKGLYDRSYGIAFIGNNGTLIVNREGWQVVAEEVEGKPLMEAVPFTEGVSSNHERHAVNFIESVKARRDPACTVEMGRAAAFMAQLGNIAFRTSSRVVWDTADRGFAGNHAANALIKPMYREPWVLPAG